jgi:hypothetical protein
MKRITVILLLVLGSAVLLPAQEQNKGDELTGTICDQKCVKQDAGKAACDLSCTERSGGAFFIDDGGKATKIANPQVCKGKMNQKAKVRAEMKKDQDSNYMFVHDVIWANAG